MQIQGAAREPARGVFRERAAEVDRSEQYPWDNVAALTEAGFMGMCIPKAHGGLGASYLDAVLVVEEMAKACGVTGRIVVEGNMGAIGAICAICAYGTQAQIDRIAPLVLAGDKPAICITEPGSGAAATDMATVAVKKGDTYVLNGVKHWITGGGVSKAHLIFAQVEENGERLGIGGFLAVRGEDDGLIIGPREPAMGLRGIPETEVRFEDLEISADMAVIPPRGIKLREQFGRPIAEFQGLQWMVADMNVSPEAARMMIWRAACSGDGFRDPLPAAVGAALARDTFTVLACPIDKSDYDGAF